MMRSWTNATQSRGGRFVRALGLATALAIALGSCAETQLAVTAVKRLQQPDQAVGLYKVGKPYQVDGVWYYPQVNYRYRETGIASWYGPKFHNRRTANGETFDMTALSAAHQTLPLPSLVRVTNLENGRSLVLRVNDRGPFAHGRIIDISRRGAKLLGFYGKGTARVRVEILPEESRQLAALALRNGGAAQIGAPRMPAVPQVPVEVADLPGSSGPSIRRAATRHTPSPIRPAPPIGPSTADGGIAKPTGVVTLTSTKPTRLFVQAGAFTQFENATRLRRKLDQLAQASVHKAIVGTNQFYRVRLGPLDDVKDADAMLERLIQTGHREAKIVVE